MKLKFIVISFVLIIFGIALKPLYIRFVELNMCMDLGICKEGLMIRTGGGMKKKLNKDICIQNKWKWDEIHKYCHIRIYY